MIEPQSVPCWADLPPVPGFPHGTAWSIWGSQDQLGALNMLTPCVVRSALGEVTTGERYQLDWSLSDPLHPSPTRVPLAHKVICTDGPGWWGCDDEIHINTQSSSQWDGFKHCATKEGVLYGGLKLEDVKQGKEVMRNGTHHWVEAGGIAGRGVLLDWARWRLLTDQTLPKACTETNVPISELLQVASFQGTVVKPGDILFVRFGMHLWYEAASVEERSWAFRENGGKWIGVRADEEAKKWIWDSHLAAVVGDNVAFEQCPGITGDGLHHWLLPLAGIPIGEMFYLEKLAKACEKQNKWTFFFTSAPLNVPGGVASTPNAIAIL
ncbi:hypothetical protein DACRYDRAFT_97006 [Dacryopinax primogenitus]|uniref:Cyclase n=1 Tax=Dacryopinax primogenitus (strain DJM 731) TaxID=1858805 RepID=M5FW10_DACPD|nr:uncharacterized protein DACRYDRAFT_97006 [Dacryopinax primogenitus]EJT97551.1 hypothetical protein DACRYDRAFT_97006 [Dacryopinax primogenitus]